MLRGVDEPHFQTSIDNLYSLFPMDIGQAVMYNPLAMAQAELPIFGGMMQQHVK